MYKNKDSIKNTHRANQLQILRFIAFIQIFLWHCDKWHLDIMPGGKGASCAVSFFFILSGFVTGYSSYGKKYILNIKEIFKEIYKKIKKLYPLYLGITMITIIYSNIPTYVAQHNFHKLNEELIQLGKNLLLIQSWFPTKYFSFCGVGWFLSTIMFLYIFNIPFKYMLNKINKKEKKYIIFIILTIIILAIIILYCYLIKNLNIEYWGYVLPISRLGEYLSGMIIGFVIVSLLDKIENNNVTKYVFTILEIISLGIWFYCIYNIKSNDLWQARIVRWILPNLFLIIIFGIGKGKITKIFSNKYLVTLGNISFECYLIHQVILKIYTLCSGGKSISKLGNAFNICICLIYTVVIAYLIKGRPLKGKNLLKDNKETA